VKSEEGRVVFLSSKRQGSFFQKEEIEMEEEGINGQKKK